MKLAISASCFPPNGVSILYLISWNSCVITKKKSDYNDYFKIGTIFFKAVILERYDKHFISYSIVIILKIIFKLTFSTTRQITDLETIIISFKNKQELDALKKIILLKIMLLHHKDIEVLFTIDFRRMAKTSGPILEASLNELLLS